MSSKPCYAHFIFGYRNLQFISSMHLPEVFLLVRWCHAIWLWFSYFLPEENNHVTLLQTFTSLLLPAYLLWTAKCSIFHSIQVFFSELQDIQFCRAHVEDTCLFGVSFTAIVLCSSSWMLFEKRHAESKQLLSSPQAAAQRVWFQYLDLVHSFIEYVDWIHLLSEPQNSHLSNAGSRKYFWERLAGYKVYSPVATLAHLLKFLCPFNTHLSWNLLLLPLTIF